MILGLAVLGATIISLYSVYGALAYSGLSIGMNQWAEREDILALRASRYVKDVQNFSCVPKRCWRWLPRCRDFEVEISEEFKEEVLNIAKADEDVQRLLNEGYNVSSIRVARIRLVVQEGGKIAMESSKALVILANGDGGRAHVEVDLRAKAVTRIVIVNIKVIEKSASTELSA